MILARRIAVLLAVATLGACTPVSPSNPYDSNSLSPKPGRLEGRLSGESGVEVGAATITFQKPGQTVPTSVEANAGGTFAAELAPGDYTVSIAAAGSKTSRFRPFASRRA